MKYEPVKDVPRRFMRSGWGVPRSRSRFAAGAELEQHDELGGPGECDGIDDAPTSSERAPSGLVPGEDRGAIHPPRKP